MEIPLISAANRGEVFSAVPMTVAFPPQTPDCSRNLRDIGPLSAREPASAKPSPSKMDFFPSSITLGGMSLYFVWTTKAPTYFVRPGVLGKPLEPERLAGGTEPAKSEAPSTPSELLPKSRLRMFHRLGILRLNVIDAHFGVFALVMWDGKIIAVPFGN